MRSVTVPVAAVIEHGQNHPAVEVEVSWKNADGTVGSTSEVFVPEPQRPDVDWEALGDRDPARREVASEELLVGRDEILRQLSSVLDGDSMGLSVISGQKRVGKTSIARTLETRLDRDAPDILSAYLEIGGYGGSDIPSTVRRLGPAICRRFTRSDVALADVPSKYVYNHDRDEPPRKQIFDKKVVAELNTMLQAVVLEGTGKAAQLDYTYSVGKTGTSSAYRDAWFIGFTGQYVTGVWLGNDDFTPMARVTGGSFPAQTWHAYMMAAHNTDNIPQIAGLPVHPVQAAEQARIAAAMAQNAQANPEIAAPAPESVKDMSQATRQVLEKLSSMLKDARPLNPSDARPDRAEAPAADSSAPSRAWPRPATPRARGPPAIPIHRPSRKPPFRPGETMPGLPA